MRAVTLPLQTACWLRTEEPCYCHAEQDFASSIGMKQNCRRINLSRLASWQAGKEGRSVGRAWAGFRSIAVRSGRVCVSCKPWQKEIPYISCSPPSIAFIRCVPFSPISSASLHISAIYLSFVKRLSSVNLHNYLARSSFVEGECAN